jgi:hypothetical protein
MRVIHDYSSPKLDGVYTGGVVERMGKPMLDFSLIIALVAALIFVESAMRVRLTRVGISCEKSSSSWWRRGYEVAETYEEVFPHSRLSRFRRIVVWLFPTCLGIYLLTVLWR